MAKHRSTTERAKWVARWRKSGLGGDRFASEHGLAAASLYRWAQQVEGSAGSVTGGFAEVRVVSAVPGAASTLTVEHPSGCVVHLSGAVDEVQLGAVLRALGSSC